MSTGLRVIPLNGGVKVLPSNAHKDRFYAWCLVTLGSSDDADDAAMWRVLATQGEEGTRAMPSRGWLDGATRSEAGGESKEVHVAGSAGREGTAADFLFFFPGNEFSVEVSLLMHIWKYTLKNRGS